MGTSARNDLPSTFRSHPTPAYAVSLVAAVLMAAMCAIGLLWSASVYPADEFRKAFVPNDAAGLVIGLPVLLGSMLLARRGRLIGLLLWPGALLFILYNYLVYAFCMPWNAAYLAYLALILTSAAALVLLARAVDFGAVRERLAGAVPNRLCGGILAALGALYLLLAAGSILRAVIAGPLMTDTALAVSLADLAVSPVWIAGGVLLWLRKPAGYAAGLGLMFSLTMLFVGLLFIFILEPFLAGTAFRWADSLVILVMSLVIVVPMGMYIRGVVRKNGMTGSS